MTPLYSRSHTATLYRSAAIVQSVTQFYIVPFCRYCTVVHTVPYCTVLPLLYSRSHNAILYRSATTVQSVTQCHIVPFFRYFTKQHSCQILGEFRGRILKLFVEQYVFAACNQQDVTFHNFFISIRRLTCFRWFFCPSSGTAYIVRLIPDAVCAVLSS